MIYGSVCSGIEAASLAWEPLGWKPAFFAQFDPEHNYKYGPDFPSAVLAHHWPDVPNHGDIIQFEDWPDYAIDLLVGGTPCQDFSLAGLRKGLDGNRGNLMLTYASIARRYRPKWLAWENVPGVLSINGGRDFASLLGLLSGQRITAPKDGWRTAGIIPGIDSAYGLAWRVLDAQFVRVDRHGRAVPQRRRRVFVIGYSGDWRRAAAVLFERESLSGNNPPRRKAAQEVAGTIEAGAGRRRGAGVDHSALVGDVARPVTAARGRSSAHDHTQETYLAFGGNRQSGPIEVAPSLQSHPSPSGRQDFESDTFVAVNLTAGTITGDVASTIQAAQDKHNRGEAVAFKLAHFTRGKDGAPADVAFSLMVEADRGDTEQVIAFDKSQITNPDNRSQPKDVSLTLPGTDQIAIAIQERAVSENLENGPGGVGVRDDGAAFTHEARREAQAVSFQTRIARNGRGYEEDLSPALNGADAGATSDMRPCVAFDCKTAGKNMGFGLGDVPGALRGEGHGGGHAAMMQPSGSRYVVRRLMPVECERLQAMPDGHTAITYRKKPAKDGPRYKAIGNSMAVNVMAWLGTRIQMVEDLFNGIDTDTADKKQPSDGPPA